MDNVVVDTDIFIDAIRAHKPGTEFLSELFKYYNVHFSAITETELLAGRSCINPAIESGIMDMLQHGAKIEVGNWIARKAGENSRNYGLNVTDSIIAATAMKIGCTLYTRNLKDFQKVKELKVKQPY